MRALIHKPQILFLDEPTTGLDPKSRKLVWDYINHLRKDKGMTIFLTTHYMEETREADKVVILDRGRIIEQGTPAELKTKFTSSRLVWYTSQCQEAEELLDALGENNTIEVLIHSDVEDVVEAVKGIEGVVKYDTADAGEGIVKCILSFESGKEIRDELCAKLAAKGLAIYGMVTNSKTLEEIFLELTDEVYVNKFIEENEAKATEINADDEAEESETQEKEAEDSETKENETEETVTAETDAEEIKEEK